MKASIQGMIYHIMKFSTRDGPGIRTTVFMKGCPLACQWCHNPESQLLEPQVMLRPDRCIACGSCVPVCSQGAIAFADGMVRTDLQHCRACTQEGACAAVCFAGARELVGRRTTVAEVVRELERDRIFFDESGGGVTFSGGEPLAQPAFLAALLAACRAVEIHTVVDTSGYAAWPVLDRIRSDVDLFLYDLKVIDEGLHRRYTGVSNAPILANLTALLRCGHAVQVRVPVIPGLNDDARSLHDLGSFLAGLPGLRGVSLLPYHRAGADKYARLGKPYGLTETRPPSDKRMDEIAGVLRDFGLTVQVGE